VALIHRAEDFTSDDPALNPLLVEGQVNPMRRDTVAVGSMGSITMRFIADNPGVWLFHCETFALARWTNMLTSPSFQVTSNGTFSPDLPSNLWKLLS
jgi:hypothetical protein